MARNRRRSSSNKTAAPDKPAQNSAENGDSQDPGTASATSSPSRAKRPRITKEGVADTTTQEDSAPVKNDCQDSKQDEVPLSEPATDQRPEAAVEVAPEPTENSKSPQRSPSKIKGKSKNVEAVPTDGARGESEDLSTPDLEVMNMSGQSGKEEAKDDDEDEDDQDAAENEASRTPPWVANPSDSTITKAEKAACPEFFQGRPVKTPQRYLQLRKYILEEWEKIKPAYLKRTVVSAALRGDSSAVARVHSFLERRGYINVGAATTKSKKRERDTERAALKERAPRLLKRRRAAHRPACLAGAEQTAKDAYPGGYLTCMDPPFRREARRRVLEQLRQLYVKRKHAAHSGGHPAQAPPAGTKPATPAEGLSVAHLELSGLRRYRRHFRLTVDASASRQELAGAVAEHFRVMQTDESEQQIFTSFSKALNRKSAK